MYTDELSVMSENELERSMRLLSNAWKPQGKSKLRGPALRASRHDSSLQNSKIVNAAQSTRINSFDSKVFDSEMTLTMQGDTRSLADTKQFSPERVESVAKSAQDRLFMEFMEAWQRCDTGEQVFESILDFILCCSESLDIIRKGDDRAFARLNVRDNIKYNELLSERSTWKLIFTLYKARLLAVPPEEEMDTDLDLEKISEKQIMERLYKSESSVREMQLVIDWLEDNATENIGGLALEGFMDKAVAWENTLHELQSKSSIPYKSTREFISHLDPDAPRRQRKHLHDLDQEDEDRLTQQILREIRCGHLETAQSLCIHAGQPWRAALFEGWKLYHDPNYSKTTNPVISEPDPVEGNFFRDIWKLCAWRMCEDSTMPLKARAAIAAYCGHIPTLLAVSTSWEDYLWSYCKVLVDLRVEREIRAYSYKTFVDMPAAYWNNEITLESVFKELAASKTPMIHKEALAPDHIVQKCLILGNIQELMEEISKWIQGSDMSVGVDSEMVSPHFLRFLTHLVLFLRRIGINECDGIGDHVIEAYVKLLIEMKECELVAWYVSQLSPDDQVYYYAAFLEEISDANERETAIKAAALAGLNIDLITKTVVENVRQQPCMADNGLEVQDVSPEDWAKISALDWLRFYPSQRTELVIQANALIAFFLASNNVLAARMAFNKVGEETIASINPAKGQPEDETYFSVELDVVPKPINLALKEYLCYKAYLDADDSFSDWFQHFHNAKPVEPVLPAGYTFIEKVSFQHKHNQYKIDLERWQLAMENQTKTTKSLLFNILTFPTGWLIDDVGVEDPERGVQMNALRSVTIPKVTFLLHLIMHSMGDYSGCVALADVVASQNHKLFKAFTKQRLQDLLLKIGESSIALMNEKKDPWGFPPL